MILFSSASKSNVYLSRDILQWQCDSMPRQLNIGDPVFIKVNGEDEIYFLGLADNISRKSQLLWPDSWQAKDKNSVPTITIRKVSNGDFIERMGAFKYGKKEK